MPDNSSYEVGYGKPPKGNQFSKGRSGNPKGRPKGSKNLATIVLRESRQPVRVNGPNGSRKVTKLEATLMQIGNKAAQGDLRASREFVSWIGKAEDAVSAGAAPLSPHEMDQKVMQTLLQRMRRISPESTESGAENQNSTDEEKSHE